MNNKFKILFYKTSKDKNEISNFLNKLDERTILRVRKDFLLLREYGLTLINTKWIKKIYRNPDLFELRTKSFNEIRIIFYFIKPITFVIVNAFIKKTSKTPRKEIDKALKRIS